MIDERYDVDVAVVGYGPTGLVAASFLGALGHRVVVVERHPSLYGLPRLTHIDGETARIIQAVADVDVALRDAQALDSFKYLNADGKTLVDLPWGGESSSPRYRARPRAPWRTPRAHGSGCWRRTASAPTT